MLNIYIDTDNSFYNKARYVFENFCRVCEITPNFVKEDSEIDVYFGNKSIQSKMKIYHHSGVSRFFSERERIINGLTSAGNNFPR